MDPFTLATGIAAILGLAGTVLASCYQYGCGVADAPRELQHLSNEIITLTGVLNALKASIYPQADTDGLPPSYYQTKLSDGQASSLKEAIKGCEQALNDVNEDLKRSRSDPTKKFGNAVRRLKWPLAQKDTMDIVGRLERYKVTFNAAIGVETLDTVRDIRNELSQSKREQETQQSAGAGKTVLVSTILEQYVFPARSRTHFVSYFYFDFREKSSQRKEAAVGALLLQLCDQLETMPLIVDKSFEEHSTKDGQLSALMYSELEALLVAVLQECPPITLVLDALDECQDRQRLLDLLVRLADSPTYNAKVLVSSRRELDIQDTFDSMPRIQIASDVVDMDIHSYLEYVIKTNRRLHRLSPSLKETILESLTVGANGMFRWARCQIEELSRLHTDKAIRQALKALPKDLDEMYARILANIPDRHRYVARRALMWLAYAVRPLDLRELADAAVIEVGTSEYDYESTYNDEHDILEVIGSLVNYSERTSEVVLAHQSIKDFLTSESCSMSIPYFHLDNKASNIELAKICLTYLLMKDFDSGPSKTPADVLSRKEQYPFYGYVAEKWPAHTRPNLGSSPQLLDLAMHLMDPFITSNFMAWLQTVVGRGRNSAFRGYSEHGTPLYYASSYGMQEIIDRLIEAKVNIDNHAGVFGGTALHAAVWRRHPGVVKTLLVAGADPLRRDYTGHSAWSLASTMGNSEIVDLFGHYADTVIVEEQLPRCVERVINHVLTEDNKSRDGDDGGLEKGWVQTAADWDDESDRKRRLCDMVDVVAAEEKLKREQFLNAWRSEGKEAKEKVEVEEGFEEVMRSRGDRQA